MSKIAKTALFLSTVIAVGMGAYFSSHTISGGSVISRETLQVEKRVRRTWFFRNKPPSESILVYPSATKDGKVLNPFLLDLKKYFDNSRLLAFASGVDGRVWWVSPDAIYSARITVGDTCCKVTEVKKITHTEQPEYRMDGAGVVAASIIVLEGEEIPYVATLEHTGWFKIFRPPLNGSRITEFALLDFKDRRLAHMLSDIVPIERAVMGFVNPKEIIIINLDGKPVIVNITIKGGTNYSDIFRLNVNLLNLGEDPGIMAKRIIEATPIFCMHNGKYESILKVETADGKTIEVPYKVGRSD